MNFQIRNAIWIMFRIKEEKLSVNTVLKKFIWFWREKFKHNNQKIYFRIVDRFNNEYILYYFMCYHGNT